MNPDDISIEIDDRSDADLILAALNKAAAAEYHTAHQATQQANAALSDYHFAEGRRYDRIATRFQEALYPEPQPDDLIEPQPDLPKDDYLGHELLTIQRQSRATV